MLIHRNSVYLHHNTCTMKRSILLLLFLTGLLLFPFPAVAQSERILSFISHITVNTDASVTITENIRVYAAGNQIRRGIFRALPVDYEDYLKTRYKARYEIISVQRDGRDEPYFTKRDGDYKLIYIGDEAVFLFPGIYTYTITYRCPMAVRFFDDYDELYWNVTGNQWAFAIDSAAVLVTMPQRITPIAQVAYTGPFGAKGMDYNMGWDKEGNYYCHTIRPLGTYEGLSFAFSFKKGIIPETSTAAKLWHFILSNLWGCISLLLVVLSSLYFLIAWFRVGRDPEKGAIAVMYYPPENMSAGGMRYVQKMGYDNKAFTAALIHMAVKKYLTIVQQGKEYSLTRKPDANPSDMLPDERAIDQQLFKNSEVLVLKNTQHQKISEAIKDHKAELRKTYQKKAFFSNTQWFIPGLLGMLAGIVCMFIYLAQLGEIAGPTLAFFMFGTAAMLCLAPMVLAWKKARSTHKYLKPILLSLFCIPFCLIFLVLTLVFIAEIAFIPMLVLLAGAGLTVLFYYLLKAPTISGRRLMDQIDGFKEYLSVTEKDELNLQNPPEKTPELFESYLPFAVALGVENAWGERFEDILREAMANNTYQPGFYRGANLAAFSAAGFTSGLSSSFSSAVSSSAVSPRSSGTSGGFSGGGFSGGGGGGGGGGGW